MNLSSSSALLDALIRGDLAIEPERCHNGHPFEPGIAEDDPTPSASFCNVCGEARKHLRHLLPVQPPTCPVCEGNGREVTNTVALQGHTVTVSCPDCKGSGFYAGKLVLTAMCEMCGGFGDSGEGHPDENPACAACVDGQREVASAVVERWLAIGLQSDENHNNGDHICIGKTGMWLVEGLPPLPDLSHLASVADWSSHGWAGVLTEVETL